jgi:hypothetical protein
MLYWETADQGPSLDTQGSSGINNGSRSRRWCSHHAVGGQGNARLASGGLRRNQRCERSRRQRHRDRRRDSRRKAAALDLIDEYREVCPVLVGEGIPYFPARAPGESRQVGTRTFSSKVVYLRYRVVR